MRLESKRKVLLRRLGKVLIACVCFWVCFMVLSRVLRKSAIHQIEELTNTRIGAESVNFHLDGSVFIEGLVIRPKEGVGYDDAILKARAVHAHFSVFNLLLMRPRLKEIVVRDFLLNCQYDLDTGRWNIAGLKIGTGKGRGEMPLIDLEGGTLQYSKVSQGRSEVLAAVPVDVKLGPGGKTHKGYRFSITTGKQAWGGESILTGVWEDGRIALAGAVSSAEISASERSWVVNVLVAELRYDREKNYALKAVIKDLVSRYGAAGDSLELVVPPFPERWRALAALQRFFNRFSPRGQIDIKVEARGNLDRLSESKLRGEVYCKDVWICDRRCPYPIEHLVGQVSFTEKSAFLNKLKGGHKGVDVTIDGWSEDFGEKWRYKIQVASDNMVLDDDLYNALGAKQKRFWSAFSPRGVAAINYCIGRQSPTEKKRTLAVKLLDAEAVYRHFPYPLDNLKGTLFFDRENIEVVDVVSQVNRRRISVNGKVTECDTEHPIYDISIKANNIPLDSTLVSALPAEERRFWSHFGVTGMADADVKVFTPEEALGTTKFVADVSLKEGSLKIAVSQMGSGKGSGRGAGQINQSGPVVRDVSAKAVITSDSIDIEQLSGRYGEGAVSLAGRIWRGGEDKRIEYCLSASAEQVELNDDLIRLLPAAMQDIVARVQPKGKISFQADLNKDGGEDCADYKISIDCLGDSVNFEQFPYPLKDVTGNITITENGIRLKDITATAADNVQITPEASTIRINGQIALSDEGFSSGQFELFGRDIFFDERLGIALPEGIRRFYLGLLPTGRFDVDLEDIKIFSAADGERYIDFAGGVKLKGCNFNTFVPVTELNAVLKIKGLYKSGDGFCQAEAHLFANSFRIGGKSFGNLKTDIDYDYQQQSWLCKNLTADCYGGKLAGKFELKCAGETASEYVLQVGFDNIDLQQFLCDAKAQDTNQDNCTSGKMSGSLSVAGRIGNGRRIGRCRLVVSNMRVGKPSPLAKLLQALRLIEPKDFVFDEMLVDSYIKQDKLFFERFDLSGEDLAFRGSGWMDLRSRNVDLTLTARGQRLATAEPSLLESLTEGLGRSVVRIEVTGDVYDPQVETKTLPVIEDSLQILGTKPSISD